MFEHNHNFKDFNRFFIGFDKIVDKANKFVEETLKFASNYPPYNIKQTGENTYVVELAVAGFGKNDLEVTLEGDTLIVKGNSDADGADNAIYQGIAGRAFTRKFKLADEVKIGNAGLVNGILRIVFNTVTPEYKVETIEINEGDKK